MSVYAKYFCFQLITTDLLHITPHLGSTKHRSCFCLENSSTPSRIAGVFLLPIRSSYLYESTLKGVLVTLC